MHSNLAIKQTGLSLIEVLVSMIIFAIGILGMATLQTRVLQENFDQFQRDTAIWQAQAIIDRVSLNKSAAALKQYETSISNANLCDNALTKTCASTSSSVASECTETELAEFDAWDVLCTDNQGVADLLTGFNASFNCQSSADEQAGPPIVSATNCALGDRITLAFLWRSRATLADPRINTSTISGTTTLATSGADTDGIIQVFVP